MRWEGFTGFAEQYLAVEAPGIIDLYVWDKNALDDVYWCGRDKLGGCFPGDGVVYSELPSVEHELVHAITEDLANHNFYFVEGVAQAVAEVTEFAATLPWADAPAKALLTLSPRRSIMSKCKMAR